MSSLLRRLDWIVGKKKAVSLATLLVSLSAALKEHANLVARFGPIHSTHCIWLSAPVNDLHWDYQLGIPEDSQVGTVCRYQDLSA